MKCSINDIANVISQSIPNPAESGYDIFVGLEHYDSGEVKITRYGSTDNLVTAVKVFQKGDILLARRNVYLKRAGLVDFDGVTSGDSIVLRVKTDLSSLGLSSASVQKYLPFVLNTEEFWNYAEKYSDGTMSKRLSPKTLLQYELEIPENIDEKNELLWAAFEAKESYRAMIRATDEMVKSQFIAHFGPSANCQKEELKKNVEEMFIGPFGSSLKNDCFVEEENGYCVVYEQKHAIEKRVDLPFRYVTQEKYQELRRFEVLPGDIIVSCRGTVGKVYRIPEGAPLGIMHPSIMKIRLKEESYQSEYFVFAVAEYMKERESKNLGTGVKMAVTAADMGKELFAKPSISAQIAFISIIHQADKSKFELKQAIKKIDKVMRSLMQ